MLKKLISAFLTLAVSACLIPSVSAAENNAIDTKQVAAGKNHGGDTKYTNFRIPGIIVSKNDTVIMYWEARMSGSDWADMDVVAVRSTDGGETFSEPYIIVEGAAAKKTVNNPVMIAGNDGILHLLYCVEYGVCVTCGDAATSSCPHGAGVFYKRSLDDGITWSEAVNISDSTFSDTVDHNVIATGPGHGIALPDRTLLVPVWLVEPENCSGGLTSHHIGSVSVLYSTDNGDSWQIGSIIPNDGDDGSEVKDPNETMAAVTSDGGVMLTTRSGGGGYRATSWSKNGISDYSEMEYDKSLIDPTCMGSAVKYDISGDPYTILHVNCESQSGRQNLTLKGSTDDGVSWKYRKTVDEGMAGYSDIAVDSKGTIFVLYEVNAGVTCNLARLDYDTLVKGDPERPVVPENSMPLYLDGSSLSDTSGFSQKVLPTDVTSVTDSSALGGASYKLDGKSAIDIVPTNGLQPFGKPFTYSLRFKVNGLASETNNQQILFWYGSVGTGKPQVWCRTRGSDLQCNFASDGVETTITASNVIQPDTWYHAVIMRDGTNHYLYLNGKLIASEVSGKVHNIAGDEALTVGASRGTSGRNRYVSGYIDEVMYFNYILTENEIWKLYTEGSLACTGGNTCPIREFDDLSPDADYHDSICYVLENGIMNGVGDGRFAPSGELNRAMLVTVLWRMENEPQANGIIKFTDVEKGTWYTEAVRWASYSGIVSGYSDTVFAPSDSLTREQLAVIMYRYANRCGKDMGIADTAVSGISDASDISDWAEDAVRWALTHGIVTDTDGKFAPKEKATREQVAKAIYELSQA